MLRGTDPGLARRLSAARERDVADAPPLDAEVATLSARIDSDRLFGRLTYDHWSDLSTRARAYEAETRGRRWDFDVIGPRSRTSRPTGGSHSPRSKLRGSVGRMRQPRLTDEQIMRVSDCIAPATLPPPMSTSRRSAPRANCPRTAMTSITSSSSSLRSRRCSPPPAAGAAERPQAGHRHWRESRRRQARRRTRLGRIDVSAIVRNRAASARIDHWLKLAAARTLDGRASNVKPILEQLGYIAADTHIPPNKAGRSPGAQRVDAPVRGARHFRQGAHPRVRTR